MEETQIARDTRDLPKNGLANRFQSQRKASFICVLKLISKPDSQRYSDHPASCVQQE